MAEQNPTLPVDETAIGPGTSVVDQIDPGSMLEGVGDYSYVEILNPLSVTFIGQAALTTNISAPMPISANHENAPGLTKSEADIRQVYGFDLRAQAQQNGKTHIINRIPIASGQTIKLLGGEAKTIVGQLVNAVMQREKKGSLLANKYERRQVEGRIVQRIGSMQDVLGRSPLSVREQLTTALNTMDDSPQTHVNEGGDNAEPEFPGLSNESSVGAGQNTVQGDGGQSASDAFGKRGSGRPKAA